MTKTCNIMYSTTSGRFYLSHGATRSPGNYATSKAAVRAAERLGYTVEEVFDETGFTSVANEVRHCGGIFTLSLACVRIEGNDLKAFNRILARLRYKRVRLTRNLLNSNSPEIVIDADTPFYCDPGSESYHSM